MIEIIQTGRFNSVQDLGRKNYRNIGVSASGAMDHTALRAGNILIGNKENDAAIEIQTFPFRIVFRQSIIFSLTGGIGNVTLDNDKLPPWWGIQAQVGQVLTIDVPQHGSRVYLCLEGGIDVPIVMGSHCTSFRGSFGGFHGRELQQGDRLQTVKGDNRFFPPTGIGAISPEHSASKYFAPLIDNTLTVRALPASEDALFIDSERTFWGQEWKITSQSDRTGYRLKGTALQPKEVVEMHSYGVVPGIVQVPPSGEPIVQMSDANTAGGYPKIAGVISADLWRLGQLRAGQKIRFVKSSYREAAKAADNIESYFKRLDTMSRQVRGTLKHYQ